MIPIAPGDVILVSHRHAGWKARIAGNLIRLGAWLSHQPHTTDHVIIAWKIDPAGTWWGIQGQPGVVASVDIRHWLTDSNTLTNAEQPKTDEQRAIVVAAAETMYYGHVGYDWDAIVIDAALAVSQHIDPLWHTKDEWGDTVPADKVCSSAADKAYELAHLASPIADRFCTPGAWEQFIERREWETAT